MMMLVPILVLQAVHTDAQNPLTIAAYVAGFMLSVPMLVVLVKAVFFIAGATNKLDAVVVSVDKLSKDMTHLRESVGSDSQSVELSLFVIETDVNALQERAGVPIRAYPDRRIGPSDRRTA
ncbi:MAG: hypothetical protein JWL61_5010 [Gemmatimonadetes bacterium]|nr:hypothetical protein [Gemmatimonadota bacterium]